MASPSSRPLLQTVRAGQGFLSQSSRWIHFGLGQHQQISQLVVKWPGTSQAEVFSNLKLDRRYEIVQGTGDAQVRPVRKMAVALPAVPLPAAQPHEPARAIVCGRIPVPSFSYQTPEGKTVIWTPDQGPTLINLWASWCQPCVEELAEWSKPQNDLRTAGLNVLAICADDLAPAPDSPQGSPTDSTAASLLDGLQFPYSWGYAESETIQLLEQLVGALFDDARPLALPTSFLLDEQGCVVAIYRGGIEPEQMRSDLELLRATPEDVRSQGTPFPGQWLASPPTPQPLLLAKTLEQQDPRAAQIYLRRLIEIQISPQPNGYWKDPMLLAKTYLALATMELRAGDVDTAKSHLQDCLLHDPNSATAHANLGSVYFRLREWRPAVDSFARAAQLRPRNVNFRVNLGLSRMQSNQIELARSDFAAAVALDPRGARARYNLARVETALGNDRVAADHLERLNTQDPQRVEVKHDLAWILATSADAAVRDAARAVALATEVCQSVPSPNASMLRTLAAAQAEAGNFNDATATLERAIELARRQPNTALVDSLDHLLQRLRENKPIRRASPSR